MAPVDEANYASGDDYVLEFLGYRFALQRRGLRAAGHRGRRQARPDRGERPRRRGGGDLVELAADGRIAEPRGALGRYLVRHWEHVALVEGESLVYWLRKLVFRGAWLDHRVKEGLLEVSWDEESGDFGYAEQRGGRALLELAPVPSWHALQFRR